MKILMFSTHSMKYIWYSPQKSKYPLYNISSFFLTRATSWTCLTFDAPEVKIELYQHARIQKIFSGGWGAGRTGQIPRRGLTENFSMVKINNLAIPGVGGGVRAPCPPAGSRCIVLVQEMVDGRKKTGLKSSIRLK